MKTMIYTPRGDNYLIHENGNIERRDIKGFQVSGQWKLLGLVHVEYECFVPFPQCFEKDGLPFPLKWKNGNPAWTVRDLDHGTRREWGNTRYHGVSGFYKAAQ